jgi:hypothetical protein
MPHHILLILTSLQLWGASAHAQAGADAPASLTAAEDHQRLLGLLGIDTLRRGAEGDPASPFAANYDEARANVNLHSLPDPLQMNDGGTVETADDWWTKRRPEIVEFFDREIYGRVPATPPAVHWEVRSESRDTLAGHPVRVQTLVGLAGAAGRHGFRPALRSGLHQLVGRGRREALAPRLRQADRQHRRQRR